MHKDEDDVDEQFIDDSELDNMTPAETSQEDDTEKMPGGQAALALALLMERKEELKAELKKVNGEIAKLEDPVRGYFIDNQQQRGTFAGRTLFLRDELFARAVPEKLENGEFEAAIKKFCDDHELGDNSINLIHQTVNANTLAAFIREIVEMLRREKVEEAKKRGANSEELRNMIAGAADLLPQYLLDVVSVSEVTKVAGRKASTKRTA